MNKNRLAKVITWRITSIVITMLIMIAIMGDVREIFSLPVDEDFVLSEHPTLNHFVDYIVRMTGGTPAVSTTPEVASAPKEPEPEVVQQVSSEQEPVHTAISIGNSGDIQPKLIGVVVKHTGYPEDFIEMDQDLEGELGIDQSYE